MDIQMGVYQHYKGNKYPVTGVARHSETLEYLVVYITLYENADGKIWVRPLEMFLEDVEYNGIKQPRFKFISTY